MLRLKRVPRLVGPSDPGNERVFRQVRTFSACVPAWECVNLDSDMSTRRTAHAKAEKNPKPIAPVLREYLSELGKKGGAARAKKLGAERLIEQAKHAASFRWPSASRTARASAKAKRKAAAA
jgi:hypothetical protein